MSVRAIRARIECGHDLLEHLWRTHCVFHQRLPIILRWLFKMRRGECGENDSDRSLYKRIGRFITAHSAQNAEYLMNSISMKGWKAASAKKYKIKATGNDGQALEISGESWADEAAKLSAQGKLVFDKQALSGDLPGCMRQMLNREAIAIIRGHNELVANWKSEHAKWLDDKRRWEAEPEHALYLGLRQRFEAFEQAAGGKATKRRGRWHLYLNWLRANPDLAAWRGGAAVVNALTTDAEERIKKAKPWKKRSVEAREFWNVNPELHVLDKLYGFYEREFVRRRKKKRNPDGFDHRPTFTMPHMINHPRWFVFNAPQTNPSGYKNLQLPRSPKVTGRIQLQLLTGDRSASGVYPTQWIELQFRSDPRLSLFRSCNVSTTINRGKAKGQAKTKEGYEFFDRYLKQWRPAEISGVKLLFRQIRLNDDGSLKSAVPYLVFACTINDLPLTERAKKIEWSETGETTKTGKKRKSRAVPDGLVACAVDLVSRNVGFATLCVFEHGHPRVLRSRNIWLDPQHAGPELAHIGRHKRQVKKLRRQRGKPVKGEQSHIEL